MFISFVMGYYSLVLSVMRVPLGQCSRVSLLCSNGLIKPKANV